MGLQWQSLQADDVSWVMPYRLWHHRALEGRAAARLPGGHILAVLAAKQTLHSCRVSLQKHSQLGSIRLPHNSTWAQGSDCSSLPFSHLAEDVRGCGVDCCHSASYWDVQRRQLSNCCAGDAAPASWTNSKAAPHQSRVTCGLVCDAPMTPEETDGSPVVDGQGC